MRGMPVSETHESETQLRSQVANAAKRHYKNPTPESGAELSRVRAALAADKLERHIRRVVDQAPELSDEVRSRLVGILRGVA